MNQEPTPDEVLAGLIGLCCCFVALVGVIALIVWLVRRGAQKAPVHPEQRQHAGPPEFHLSVLALAFDATFRPHVERLLDTSALGGDPVGQRVALVQRVAQALVGVAPQWRFFGYGEKDLNELAAAQQSYSSAVADFRGRAASPGDGGALTVLTLILCTRGRRLGVDRLDTRQQIHDLLHDRLRLDAASLLGAEVSWAPGEGALSEALIAQRFPEMHAVVQ